MRNRLDDAIMFTNGMPIRETGSCLPGHDFTNGIWHIPRITELTFGWTRYHMLSAANMWLDDVIVSDARVGCPPAQ